jgi:hypothetical protein
MKDPEFLQEAKRLSLEVKPMTGEELTSTLRNLYNSPKPLVDQVRALRDAK